MDDAVVLKEPRLSSVSGLTFRGEGEDTPADEEVAAAEAPNSPRKSLATTGSPRRSLAPENDGSILINAIAAAASIVADVDSSDVRDFVSNIDTDVRDIAGSIVSMVTSDPPEGADPTSPSKDEEMATIAILDADEKKGPLCEPDSEDKTVIGSAVDLVKCIGSLALLVFSVVVVMAALLTNQTTAASYGVPPTITLFVFWFLIIWLATIEGGQGCLIGLQPLARDLYAGSHAYTLKCTTLAHRGDNMERFIVGRQFLVVLIVFLANMAGGATADASVLGLPDSVAAVFLASGLAITLVTVMLGQLTAQVNAAACMLDFINTPAMLASTYVSLAIEWSGLLHCVYVVQRFFSLVSGRPVPTKEPPHTRLQSAFFYFRVLLSLFILSFSCAVTFQALFVGKTTSWDGLPVTVSVCLFIALMCFVGLLEGMQIALFAVVNLPQEQRDASSVVARANCEFAFAGNRFQAFLIGRQVCVTVCMFLVARITTLSYAPSDASLWGAPSALQAFYNTGLLGAVITTVFASLAWRVVAASFPLAFMANPLVALVLRLCLLLEASGVCSAAWLLARLHRRVARLQADKVYLENGQSREMTEDFQSHESSSASGFSDIQRQKAMDSCVAAV